jgi:hypothetical protein
VERFLGVVVSGAMIAILYTAVSAMLVFNSGISVGVLTANLLWRIFIFSIFAFLGAVITELKLGDPDLQ